MLSIVPLAICSSHASDSITSNQSLPGDQNLFSVGGNFELGFFTKNKASSKFYIGIWYKRVSELTPVWVANRATPVSDITKCLLHISPDGNLALLDQSINSLVWSTNATIPSNSSTVAVLQDNGNLVLRDPDNSSNIFWQSFDNPTHMWLPGCKISFNKITKVSRRIISWKNSEDPAPGLFSNSNLEDTQNVLQWNMSKIYWTSGPWNGLIFTKLPEMTSQYLFKLTFVNTSEESYFTFSLLDNTTTPYAAYVMDVSGQMKALLWLEVNRQWTQIFAAPAQCDVTKFCGPFGICNELRESCLCVKGFSQRSPKDWALSDHSLGCVRDIQLQYCDGTGSDYVGERDKFFQMSSVRLPDDGQSLQVGSDDECMQACLYNCSCTAYSYNGTGCTVWYGDLYNLQDQYEGSGGGTLYLRLAASELPNHHKKGSVSGLVAGLVAASLVCFGIVCTLVTIRIRRRRAFKLVMGPLVAFRYSDLQRVTKNFSDKLGAGSFGSVSKGVLPDSTAIAVKKLEGLRQGEKQFRTEVSTLGTIQHVNLVRFCGFCAEGKERLLVFDYMPNGSLDSRLFRGNDNVLDWSTRYRIALGIARGLEYLHEKCRECIIHCDIKPENILLDAEFNPKVADFGLAKLLGREFSHVLTSMRGTIGYLAPEWITGLAITPKADVYSFGMMLLEIISGKRNTEQLAESGESDDYYFPAVAAVNVREDTVQCLLDDRLQGNANMDELIIACRVACWCIQGLESQRPTMGLVVRMLEGLTEVSIPPIPSIFRALDIDAEN
ncbi:S-receptor-like serine/threonine-protein kinase protein [Dioscorea alata]|uniref:S-receptor-like serine/threonine-protein kinase protein n=1 Tax=Dioscorea alata TaxID=55571 RepID=A0ACB7UP62_DIOAL|nr:S-receptor-like serine/threonine-protein kinase protein [Dioscorea alata]